MVAQINKIPTMTTVPGTRHQNPKLQNNTQLWAARRCPYSEIWVIRIKVPKSFIDGLESRDLWYSPDRKEYVWYCKKKDSPPSKFDSYWKETELLKGHICTGIAFKSSKNQTG